MTLIIQKPTGAKLNLRNALPADAEADAYIAAVEAADGQALEPGVKFAIKNFVLCCKDDGIWNAIKASCILAGARTLSGALVPLVGTAPTNFNFVAGDYNRKTGLKGNGSTKYLNSNRNNNADPQDSNHNAVFLQTAGTATAAYLGANTGTGGTGDNGFGRSSGIFFRNRTSGAIAAGSSTAIGFMGASRSSGASFILRLTAASASVTAASQVPFNGNISVFAAGSAGFPTDARIAFYSIGESLDLAALDTRVTDLMNAIGAAIP